MSDSLHSVDDASGPGGSIPGITDPTELSVVLSQCLIQLKMSAGITESLIERAPLLAEEFNFPQESDFPRTNAELEIRDCEILLETHDWSMLFGQVVRQTKRFLMDIRDTQVALNLLSQSVAAMSPRDQRELAYGVRVPLTPEWFGDTEYNLRSVVDNQVDGEGLRAGPTCVNIEDIEVVHLTLKSLLGLDGLPPWQPYSSDASSRIWRLCYSMSHASELIPSWRYYSILPYMAESMEVDPDELRNQDYSNGKVPKWDSTKGVFSFRELDYPMRRTANCVSSQLLEALENANWSGPVCSPIQETESFKNAMRYLNDKLNIKLIREKSEGSWLIDWKPASDD